MPWWLPYVPSALLALLVPLLIYAYKRDNAELRAAIAREESARKEAIVDLKASAKETASAQGTRLGTVEQKIHAIDAWLLRRVPSPPGGTRAVPKAPSHHGEEPSNP